MKEISFKEKKKVMENYNLPMEDITKELFMMIKCMDMELYIIVKINLRIVEIGIKINFMDQESFIINKQLYYKIHLIIAIFKQFNNIG